MFEILAFGLFAGYLSYATVAPILTVAGAIVWHFIGAELKRAGIKATALHKFKKFGERLLDKLWPNFSKEGDPSTPAMINFIVAFIWSLIMIVIGAINAMGDGTPFYGNIIHYISLTATFLSTWLWWIAPIVLAYVLMRVTLSRIVKFYLSVTKAISTLEKASKKECKDE